jgi:hypothetical protein
MIPDRPPPDGRGLTMAVDAAFPPSVAAAIATAMDANKLDLP